MVSGVWAAGYQWEVTQVTYFKFAFSFLVFFPSEYFKLVAD